jgi:hypothetical protein
VPDRRNNAPPVKWFGGDTYERAFFGFQSRGTRQVGRSTAMTLLPQHINQHFSVRTIATTEFSLRRRGRSPFVHG